MDIGISNIVPIIAQSTTDYLASFSPLFLFIGGLILAFVVISAILGFLPGTKNNDDMFDERRPGDWI